MRVLLISLNRESEPFTAAPLGMAFVSGALIRAGHDVLALDLLFSSDARKDIEEAIESFRPGLVGLSLRNIESSTEFLLPSYREAVEIIKGLTASPIAAGGPGFSIMPRQVLEYLGLELGIAGEGERATVELAGALEEGRDPAAVPGVCTLKDGRYSHTPSIAMPDLSGAVSPAWGLLPVSQYDMVGVQSKRGCSFSCIYCTYPSLEGRDMRLRPPEEVADEIADTAAMGATAFYFVDNVFNNPPEHAEAVCRALIDKKVDAEWGALVSPKGLDAPLLKLMYKAGCRSVEIGADSLSDSMLKGLGKSFRAIDVRAAVSACKEAGMMHMVFLILGGPGEDEGTLRETFDTLDEIRPDKAFAVAGIRIYPGTPLALLAAREGVIRPHDDLLMPVFYASSGLGERLYTLAKDYFRTHPDWIYYPANGVASKKPILVSSDIRWDDESMCILDNVLSSVPRILRPIAKRAVTKKAGRLAVERGLAGVTTAEVRDAFLSETPGPFQSSMRESLKKSGLING